MTTKNDWKLTLPVDENGVLNNGSQLTDPMELTPFQYQDYSQYSQYVSFGAIQLVCPVDGQTTSAGTKYPRTELRELEADGSLSAWSGSRKMEYSLSVDSIPDCYDSDNDIVGGRIVIGQVKGHDNQGAERELMRLYAERTAPGADTFKLYAQQDSDNEDVARIRHIFIKEGAGEEALGDIRLGSLLGITVTAQAESIQIDLVHQNEKYECNYGLSSNDGNTGRYFKAGLYMGVSSWQVEGKYGRAVNDTDIAAVMIDALPVVTLL